MLQLTKYIPERRRCESTPLQWIGRKNNPIAIYLIKAVPEDGLELLKIIKGAHSTIIFTVHCETKKTQFDLHFGRKPGTNLSIIKGTVPVDSQNIARNPVGDKTDDRVMSKKDNDLNSGRGMTLTQTKKPSNTVRTNRAFNYPFLFFN